MINELKLFCTIPKGVVIKKIAIVEGTQKICACTNKGVWLIDKDGNPKQVVDGPLPGKTTFMLSGLDINQGEWYQAPKGLNTMFQEEI